MSRNFPLLWGWVASDLHTNVLLVLVVSCVSQVRVKVWISLLVLFAAFWSIALQWSSRLFFFFFLTQMSVDRFRAWMSTPFTYSFASCLLNCDWSESWQVFRSQNYWWWHLKKTQIISFAPLKKGKVFHVTWKNNKCLIFLSITPFSNLQKSLCKILGLISLCSI